VLGLTYEPRTHRVFDLTITVKSVGIGQGHLVAETVGRCPPLSMTYVKLIVCVVKTA
jgi:hypothetical protein